MYALANGCRCSELTVHPENWNTTKASLKKEWRVQYRFYDPVFKDDPKIKGRKLILLRDANKFHTIEERQLAIKALIENEKDLLFNQQYNPITRISMPKAEQTDYEIHPSTFVGIPTIN